MKRAFLKRLANLSDRQLKDIIVYDIHSCHRSAALDVLTKRVADKARSDGINEVMSPSAPRNGW